MKDPKAYYLRIIFAPLLLVSMFGCATEPTIKMPDSLPSSIKSYKHFTLWAGNPGMKGTGVQLNKGDTYTVLATGSMDYCRAGGCDYRDVRPEQGWPLVARIGRGLLFCIPCQRKGRRDTARDSLRPNLESCISDTGRANSTLRGTRRGLIGTETIQVLLA